MDIQDFHIKDVRCFAGEHSLRIRPVTFLIGENSTGKSTVLGCMQAFGDLSSPFVVANEPDFNRPPYQMGSYREIARKSRPLSESFELGMTWRAPNADGNYHCRVTLSERPNGTEPIATIVEWRLPSGEQLVFELNSAIDTPLAITTPDGEMTDAPRFHIECGQRSVVDWAFNLQRLRYVIENSDAMKEMLGTPGASLSRLTSLLRKCHEAATNAPRRFESIAPIRSQPRRTYDPVVETPSPEGADVPVTLMNLAKNKKSEWDFLKTRLTAFGNDSGLFKDLKVRRLGRSGSDPFQLAVQVRGPLANLVDTGYGVSQILPILVRILRKKGPRPGVFLLQQPEVHLHPRGQAALTSFLIDTLQGKRRPTSYFLIETHSDYMVDRAQIEIRRRRIRPEDVSVIYLEHAVGKGVRTHNLTFDEMGNLENPPRGYRQFFLQETDNLLGFGD